MTEPLEGVKLSEWKEFERSGYSHPEQFLSSQGNLGCRLRYTETLLHNALQAMQDSSIAYDSPKMLLDYCRSIIDTEIAVKGITARAKRYKNTLASLERYLRTLGQTDVYLIDVDGDFVSGYFKYCAAAGLKRESAAAYGRIFQAIYNSALRNRLTPDRMPFAGITLSPKALGRSDSRPDINNLQRLFDADFSDNTAMAQARDVLKLSYFTGLNFRQISSLRPEHISDSGIVVDKRLIPIDAPIREMLKYYSSNDYLFYPEVKSKKSARNYTRVLRRFTSAVKAISERLQIPASLNINAVRILGRDILSNEAVSAKDGL